MLVNYSSVDMGLGTLSLRLACTVRNADMDVIL